MQARPNVLINRGGNRRSRVSIRLVGTRSNLDAVRARDAPGEREFLRRAAELLDAAGRQQEAEELLARAARAPRAHVSISKRPSPPGS